MGGVTAPHWAYFENMDTTNYVQILTALSGVAFIRLYPGEVFIGPIDNARTAPAAIANTAACLLKYTIINY